MTFEETLASIDASLKTLVLIAQTGAAAPAEIATPAETKAKGTRASKNNPTESPSMEGKHVKADSRYFHIPKHNTVAVVRPGDVVPTIESTVEITGAEYETLKAQYAAEAAKPKGPEWKAVTDKATEVSKAPGGREKLKALLEKHGKAKFPELEALGKHAELIAEMEEMLKPAEVEEDDLGIS